MSPAAQGLLALLVSNIIWGLSPLYYKLLDHVPPLEILSHRTVWSLVIFAVYLAIQNRLPELLRAVTNLRTLIWLAIGALMISINWSLFIWAIQIDRVVETSLGYFMFPLVSVIFGIVMFGEGLGAAKLAAIILASIAVLVLSVGLSVPPYLSLILALSFGTYGVIKKMTDVRPVVSVTGEVMLFTPLALIWLWGVHNHGWILLTDHAVGAFGDNWRDSAILVLSGPLTAVPLMLFSYATKRLNLATVGLMQYINPTLQFLVAIVVLAKPFTRAHAIAFPLIWAALAIYSVQAIRQDRAARRPATASPTV